jgi:RNA polymerase sigma-70 factor (sigma-E family)
MDPGHPTAVLEELFAVRGAHLRRTATLLAASPDEGEDLLQAAVERAFRRWRSISGDPEGYLRRTMYNLAADGWRRRQALQARLPLLGAAHAQPDGTSVIDDRDHLLRLLRDLPPRQRTAIVLRYWEDLAEDDAARAMGCSPSTVRSATARGLAHLRELGQRETGQHPSPGDQPHEAKTEDENIVRNTS